MNEISEYRNRLYKIRKIKNIKDLNGCQKHILVIKECINFFEEYGYDIEVLFYYGIALRMNGFYKEAIEIFNKTINVQNEEKNYTYYTAARLELFKVYYITNNFEKAYELWDFAKTNLKHQTEKDVYHIDLHLKMRLGLEHDEVNEKNVFILDYNPELALEHIKKHSRKNCNNFNTIFASEINIEQIFNLATECIKNSNVFPLFSSDDVYLFKFPNIGENGESILKVIANKGTNEIITMYPTEIEKTYQEKINYTDFINNNLYEEYISQKGSKVKRLSQIDKFKNRFSR